MIRINLLPHREAAKKARREQFFVLAALVVLLGSVIVFGVYSVIDGSIGNQEEANNFLKREIALLDKQLDQIKHLKEQTQSLLSRKQVIEDLQRDRGETVYLLSELVRQVPDGIYLRSVKQDGLKVSITGLAQSNARISALMRNLEASEWLEVPQLVESKATVTGGRRINDFSMNFSLTRVNPVEEKDIKSKGKVAK